MAPTLYLSTLSPPSMAVQITAKVIGVDLNLVVLDLAKGEHRKPEYTKLNPLHTVPLLVDDDLKIVDSHVINDYLIETYAKDSNQGDDLRPKDKYQRLLVSQRQYFDAGGLFNLFRATAAPIFYRKTKTVPEDQVNRILEGYGFVESFLTEHEWIAGKNVTIADISLATTVCALNIFVPIDGATFPKVQTWIGRCRGLSYFKISEKGFKELEEVIKSFMA